MNKKTMKQTIITLLVVLCFRVNAQVSNDDCFNAIRLNDLDGLPPYWGGNCATFSNYMDTCLNTSNINAVPNFPYYSMSGCTGYQSSTASPANDVWYKVNPLGETWLYLSYIWSIPRFHLNVWRGADCTSLIPVNCYTFDSSMYILKDTIYIATNDFLFLQFSGDTVGSFGYFQFELGASPILWTPTISTSKGIANILCFDYEMTKTNVSVQGANDGTAIPLIHAGNSPYSFNWSDSSTDSLRFNLSAGKYFVTITDVNGCSETDNVLISVDSLPTSVSSKEIKFNIYPNPADKTLTIETDYSASLDLILFDLAGKERWQETITGKKQTLNLKKLNEGVFLFVLKAAGTNAIVHQGKLLIIR